MSKSKDQTDFKLNYQRILMHILIDNSFPAIVMDDYSLRIELIRGQYFTKQGYELTKSQMPYPLNIRVVLEKAFNADWETELNNKYNN